MKLHLSKKILCTALAVPVLLAAVLGAVLFGCRMGPEIQIGGLDVSGKSLWEAWQAVNRAEDAMQEKTVTLHLPEQTITLTPQDSKLRIRGLSLAWEAWRGGKSIPLTGGLGYREKALRTRLEAYASQYDTTLTQSAYSLQGTAPALDTQSFDSQAPGQSLVVTLGTPECHLDIPAAVAEVEAFLGEFREVYEVTLDVVPTALPEGLDLERIQEEFTVEAVNDSLDMTTYQLLPGSYGYGFDLATAQKALAEAGWGSTVEIAMEATAPEILGEGVYFRDLLGHCETKHTDDENRNTNLRLVCQTLDGMILQPGEEFSYNGAVGERTEERGYKAAGAYSGNRLIKDIGGGVCQGSTTLYNCALLADLEILERNCHGFTVNYVPIGLDAAVNWATKTDLKFKNNWNFPIQIRAEVSDGCMKMALWGTDEKDYYIEMTSGYSEEELRIYSNSYKNKYDKTTGEKISRDLEARSSYMYMP